MSAALAFAITDLILNVNFVVPYVLFDLYKDFNKVATSVFFTPPICFILLNKIKTLYKKNNIENMFDNIFLLCSGVCLIKNPPPRGGLWLAIILSRYRRSRKNGTPKNGTMILGQSLHGFCT